MASYHNIIGNSAFVTNQYYTTFGGTIPLMLERRGIIDESGVNSNMNKHLISLNV